MHDKEKLADENRGEELERSPAGVALDSVPILPIQMQLANRVSGNQESARISQWIAQVRDIEEIAACEAFCYDSSLDAIRANADPMTPYRPTTLVDNGAASSDVGRSWVVRWHNLDRISQFLVCIPSNRAFRFGNKMTYSSRGAFLLSGKGQRSKR